MMTTEQQKIAIAEWGGYEVKMTDFKTYEVLKNGKGLYSDRTRFYDNHDQALYHEYPDYPNDLNAIHEAEKKLPPHKRGFYNAELSKLASNRNLSSAVKEPEFIFMLLNATSQQRSEALCRTLFPERFI